MKLPLSWLKEYVDLDLPLEDIARALLSVGLEVEQITVVGLPFKDTSAVGYPPRIPHLGHQPGTRTSSLSLRSWKSCRIPTPTAWCSVN